MSKILDDIKMYSKGSIFKAIVTLFLNPNFHCVLIYRIAHALGNLNLRILPRILIYINRIIYSVDIDYRAKLAGGFQLIHGIGTVIGLDVITLGPVKVYQGVTLGGNSGKSKEWNSRVITQPILYPNTIVYANATVVGPVCIGENSVIGANSLITRDVNPNTTVYCKFQKTFFEDQSILKEHE